MKKLFLGVIVLVLIAGAYIVGTKQSTNSSDQPENEVADSNTSHNDSEVTDTNSTNNDSNENTESTENNQSTNDEDNESNNEADHDSSNTNDYSDYEEFETIDKHIDVDSYNVDVVEDNRNKRVVLFTNGSHKVEYKSIYIKHKKRLKIVDKNDGLIFNERI